MTKVSKDLYMIRDAAPTDLGFIYSTWLKGLYFGNDWFRAIDQETYFDRYHKVIEAVLFKPTTTIKAAVLRDDPDVILGYAVYEPGVLHWVFTKAPWRKFGIAKSLVPQDTSSVTHLTKVGLSIKPKHIKFDPFITA